MPESTPRPARPVSSVAIVVVTHDPPPGVLEAAVRSLAETLPRSAGPAVVAAIVVDNGGAATDRLARAGLAGAPAGATRFRVEQVPNRGFAHAVNHGFELGRAAGADVLVCLNDDVVVRHGWLDPLLAALGDDPSLGAVQPVLVEPGGGDGDGAGDRIASAGVEIDRYGAGTDRRRGDRLPDAVSVGGPDSVDVVTGGAAAFRSTFVDAVGPADERFFLYYEDVEWCRRGAAAGWRFAVVPAAIVEHTGSATTTTLGERRTELLERNRLWCTAMTADGPTVLRSVWLSIRRLRHEPRRAHLRGFVAGIAGVPSRLVRRRSGPRPLGPR